MNEESKTYNKGYIQALSDIIEMLNGFHLGGESIGYDIFNEITDKRDELLRIQAEQVNE